jgi:hypothetical protein
VFLFAGQAQRACRFLRPEHWLEKMAKKSKTESGFCIPGPLFRLNKTLGLVFDTLTLIYVIKRNAEMVTPAAKMIVWRPILGLAPEYGNDWPGALKISWPCPCG